MAAGVAGAAVTRQVEPSRREQPATAERADTSGTLVLRDGEVRRGGFELRVSLAVGPGEIVALVGPNGCGKTTTLHALAGLLPLAGGEVRCGDRVLDGVGAWVSPQQRRIGWVPQSGLLLRHLSALENVAFGPRAQGSPRADARTAALEWLERFGLASLGSVRADRLSGGQAQAVAVVRAFASRPRAILLDEPFSALDVDRRPALRALVRAEVVRLGVPAVLVSHDAAEVAEVADRVIAL